MSFLRRSVRIWRFDIPMPVLILIGITLVASITNAIAGNVLAYLGCLSAEPVLGLQLWRLFTWVFFELQPFGLLFALLTLVWFGKDLCAAWGPWRWLAFYFAFPIGIGIVTVAIGKLVWNEVYETAYTGSWALANAIIIAWARTFPDREIFLFFVMKVGGKALIAITVVLTLLFAIYYGFASFVPHFLAEGAMISYMFVLRPAYLRWRLKRLEREQAKAVKARTRPRSAAHLRVIEGGGGDDGEQADKPRWLN